jgi:signal transduction histidine kinase/ligand-binding sensor domain-containing protein
MIAIANCAYALDTTRTIDQYARTVWNASNGFGGGRINAISQTADGYLWIGTEAGIVRFDGAVFTQVDTPDRFRLDHILALSADASGAVWVRSLDPSLLRYENRQFAAPRPTSSHDPLVTAMAPGRNGATIFASKSDGLFTWSGSGFQSILGGDELPSSPVTAIAQAPSGDFWLGTVDSGVVRVHDRTLEQITRGLPSLRVTCVLADGHETYVGTDHGFVRWDGAAFTTDRIPQALQHLPIRAVVADRDRNIWVGSDHGLIRLDPQGVASVRTGDAGRAITALFEDREGDLWVGSVDQLERIQETPFLAHRPITPGAQDNGGPVYADAQGDVWFVSAHGVIERVHHSAVAEIRVPDFGDDQIYSMAGDADGLWLGTQKHGLAQITLSRGVPQLKTSVEASPVYVVHQGRDHSVWAGTIGGGAIHVQNGHITTYTSTDGLASNVVLSVSEGPDGTMWFGTPSGLTSFSQHRWRTYGAGDGLPSANVYSTFVDGEGIVWAGTLSGLGYVRSGHAATAPAGVTPSAQTAVLGIAEDRLGSLWSATANAVLRIDRKKLLDGTLSSADVREFGRSDGLSAGQGIRRSPTISVDPAGIVWISRADGVVSINPDRVRRTAVPTLVHVSQVTIDGNQHDLDGSSLNLRSDTKRVSIRFEGLNLSSPERIRYRFALDGFDAHWNESGTSREAVYTNLGPGTYRFHVLASNGDQMWEGAEASLSFTIVPAFWQTGWFQVVCVTAITLVALVMYRLRMHHLTEQVRLQLEARFAERNRIARDLHDTLLQSFQGLLLRFQAVENLLPDEPVLARHSLEIAIGHAARAITEGRDAVQELRRDESRSALIETLTSLGEELNVATAGQAAPSYRVLVEGTPREIHPRLEDDLYRISREAVSNAFRHARATHVELDIRYDPKRLRLRIRDDGVGMGRDILAQRRREGHWGLTGMQERALAMKGSLDIWSEVNRGTEIELTVPGHIVYMRVDTPAITTRTRNRE